MQQGKKFGKTPLGSTSALPQEVMIIGKVPPLMNHDMGYGPCDVSQLFPFSIKNSMGPYQRTPKLLELLDTQVEGCVQSVLLEISWTCGKVMESVLGLLELH